MLFPQTDNETVASSSWMFSCITVVTVMVSFHSHRLLTKRQTTTFVLVLPWNQFRLLLEFGLWEFFFLTMEVLSLLEKDSHFLLVLIKSFFMWKMIGIWKDLLNMSQILLRCSKNRRLKNSHAFKNLVSHLRESWHYLVTSWKSVLKKR